MTALQLSILAHRFESQGPLVGDRDCERALELAREARKRAEMRELFERAGVA